MKFGIYKEIKECDYRMICAGSVLHSLRKLNHSFTGILLFTDSFSHMKGYKEKFRKTVTVYSRNPAAQAFIYANSAATV